MSDGAGWALFFLTRALGDVLRARQDSWRVVWMVELGAGRQMSDGRGDERRPWWLAEGPLSKVHVFCMAGSGPIGSEARSLVPC